jgi:hypothetical protein
MKLHLVLGLNGPESVATLTARIESVYGPEKCKQLADRPAWLVADNALASDVSEKLGINAGEGGISALVTSISNYFGRAEPELWEWMKLRLEERPDGSQTNSTI